jgi:hypothetical protein
MTGWHRKVILAPTPVWKNAQATTFQIVAIISSGQISHDQVVQTSPWTFIAFCVWHTVSKKNIYSCVQCRKGFHITCFAAFHHPELVEEEFRNSFDITARVAATRSRASQSKYISVNPSFTPPS